MNEQRLRQILDGILIKQRDGGFRKTTLSERMEYFHCPAFSFAVLKDGQIDMVYATGSKRHDVNDPVLPSSPFRFASVSKIVTAVAAVKLCVQGVLDLDTDVHEYFNDGYVLPADEGFSNKVTLRQIFGHLAGLNSPGYDGYVAGSPTPTLRELIDGKYPSRTGPLRVVRPQNTFVQCTAKNNQGPYSGGGYCLAQKAICEMTGRDFADVIDELVFTP